MKHLLLIALLISASSGATLYIGVSADSHLFILNYARDTLWRSSYKYLGRDSALVQVSDSIVGGIWRSKTSVVTGAGSAAFGVSCTTGSALGATVSGGIANVANADSAFVGGGGRNRATGRASFIGGGYDNASSGITSVVGGGRSNTSNSTQSTVGGGYSCTAGANWATVSGGYSNNASSYTATIGGGEYGVASGEASTVAGGSSNSATAIYAAVGGGIGNKAIGYASTIPGGIAIRCSAYAAVAVGCSSTVRLTDSGTVVINPGRRKVTSSGKWQIVLGDAARTWDDDSLVTQPGVDAIHHGPMTLDSAFTLTGVKCDSWKMAADTTVLTLYIMGKTFPLAVSP